MTIHKEFKTNMNVKVRKTKMEILKTIKEFIEKENSLVFTKSSMKSDPWNLDPRTVDEFIRLAHFCQNYFPRIRIQEKNGKVLFQHLDYQELKKEISEIALSQNSITDPITVHNDPFNPKVFPVFKCRECDLELEYPSHYNEPMNHIKSTGMLICAFRSCDFTRHVPEHHGKKMEIFVKYLKHENKISDQGKG